MADIIIRITVPDGVNVNVEHGDSRPFIERPVPPEPEGYCPVHEEDWKLVPAGISKKTGKRYNAFWCCPVRGCDEKPPRDDE